MRFRCTIRESPPDDIRRMRFPSEVPFLRKILGPHTRDIGPDQVLSRRHSEAPVALPVCWVQRQTNHKGKLMEIKLK